MTTWEFTFKLAQFNTTYTIVRNRRHSIPRVHRFHPKSISPEEYLSRSLTLFCHATVLRHSYIKYTYFSILFFLCNDLC